MLPGVQRTTIATRFTFEYRREWCTLIATGIESLTIYNSVRCVIKTSIGHKVVPQTARITTRHCERDERPAKLKGTITNGKLGNVEFVIRQKRR